MGRSLILIYGAVCYAGFLATFVYALGFLTNVGVPKSIDSHPIGSAALALLVDGVLLSLFALQHSVMARPAWKGIWTRIVPPAAERPTYVLASSLVMALLFWGWHPIPSMLFSVDEPTARALLYGVFGVGVGLVLYSTFLIDHFDLFGLRQVVLHFRGEDYTEKRFMTPSLYKHIRHPLYLGWFVTFWATPDMTIGHLLFAGTASAYILVAIVFEERDLAAALGADYRAWRERTPKFVPLLTRRSEPTARSHQTA